MIHRSQSSQPSRRLVEAANRLNRRTPYQRRAAHGVHVGGGKSQLAGVHSHCSSPNVRTQCDTKAIDGAASTSPPSAPASAAAIVGVERAQQLAARVLDAQVLGARQTTVLGAHTRVFGRANVSRILWVPGSVEPSSTTRISTSVNDWASTLSTASPRTVPGCSRGRRPIPGTATRQATRVARREPSETPLSSHVATRGTRSGCSRRLGALLARHRGLEVRGLDVPHRGRRERARDRRSAAPAVRWRVRAPTGFRTRRGTGRRALPSRAPDGARCGPQISINGCRATRRTSSIRSGRAIRSKRSSGTSTAAGPQAPSVRRGREPRSSRREYRASPAVRRHRARGTPAHRRRCRALARDRAAGCENRGFEDVPPVAPSTVSAAVVRKKVAGAANSSRIGSTISRLSR